MARVVLDGRTLSLEQIEAVSRGGVRVELAPSARERVRSARALVEARLDDGEPHYGINTGFGTLAEVRIPRGDLERLQRNLVLSHAAGVGQPLPLEEARALVLLRANVLAKGHSGIREETLDLVLALDASDTMGALDFRLSGRPASRLDAVKAVVRDFLAQDADAIVIGNTAGDFLAANERATALTGYSREELLRMNMRALFAPDVLRDKPLRYDRVLAGEGVVLGPGDDAAVLRAPGGEDLVATVDAVVEGVHFDARFRPEEIGWKALAVTLAVGERGMALQVGDASYDIPSLGRSAEGVVTQDLKTLATRLKAVKGEFPDQASIIVTAEDTVPYGDLVHVIDACMAAGLAQVSVTGV